MKTLIYLGLVNSTRNLGRTLLTVIAMAMAAFMMTSTLTLGEGYTAGRAAEYRAFLGGDLLVYPAWAWPTETDVAGLKPGNVGLATLPPHFGSPLAYFHPDYYSTGYLTTAPGGAPTYSMFGSREEMSRAIGAISGHPEVAGVIPYEAVPVMRGNLAVAGPSVQGLATTPAPLGGFFLRACPPNLLGDAGDEIAPELRLVYGKINPPDYVMAASSAGQTLGDVMDWKMGVVKSGGRPVTAADGDALVAVVNRRAVIPRADIQVKSVASGGPDGQAVSLTLPRIVSGAQGQLRYDFANPVTVDIRVVGTYDVDSRLYHWVLKGGVSFWEQLYMETPELLMPRAGFQRVLEAMGLPPGGVPPVGALVLRLGDQSKAEEAVTALRQAVPDFSVVSVAAEVDYANRRDLPEKVYVAPPEFRHITLPERQPAVPAEANSVFGIILFGFAGLVAAGNTTLLVLSRRNEFAILKAIGLRGFEVALMVVVEVLTLAVIGLVVGFAAGAVGSLPVMLTNGVGWDAALRRLALNFGVVALATLGCSVLFSLVPMSKTLAITVAEAMRGNE